MEGALEILQERDRVTKKRLDVCSEKDVSDLTGLTGRDDGPIVGTTFASPRTLASYRRDLAGYQTFVENRASGAHIDEASADGMCASTRA